MFGFEIITKPTFEINTQIISKIFKYINLIVNIPQNGNVNIVFVGNKEIQELNKNYRNKDYVTDVLSFHYYSDYSTLKLNEIAGELIFCEDKIKLQANEFGLGEEKEFYKLLIHSILHILGYDHENDNDYEVMQTLEIKIWNEIFEKNI